MRMPGPLEHGAQSLLSAKLSGLETSYGREERAPGWADVIDIVLIAHSNMLVIFVHERPSHYGCEAGARSRPEFSG